MKKQLVRAAAATVLGLGLTTGFAAADIDTTGPHSNNTVRITHHTRRTVNNDNDVHLSNRNDQHAYSGDARVSNNTNAGDASTGSASNDNSLDASVSIDNSSSSAAALSGGGGGGGGASDANISNTGPNSTNRITVDTSNNVSVRNDNDLSVYNSNHQSASSGDARVSGNTNGGSASTGDASNSNSSSFTLNVSN
jgi:hypothetical protein